MAGSWLGGGGIRVEYQYPDAGHVPLACSGSTRPPSDVGVAYDPTTGEVTVDVDSRSTDPAAVAAVAAEAATTLEIRSAAGLFHPENAKNLGLEFDQIDAHRILKQTDLGFERLYLGAVLAPGLSAEELTADLTIDGTTLLGTALGQITVAVPEPSSMSLMATLAVATAIFTRRRV